MRLHQRFAVAQAHRNIGAHLACNGRVGIGGVAVDLFYRLRLEHAQGCQFLYVHRARMIHPAQRLFQRPNLRVKVAVHLPIGAHKRSRCCAFALQCLRSKGCGKVKDRVGH